MSDIKRVNKTVLSIAIDYGIAKALREFPDFVEKFPNATEGDPDVLEINIPEAADKLEELADQFKKDMIGFFGELPEVDPGDLYNPSNPPPVEPEEPTEEMYGMEKKIVFKRNGDMMNDGTTQAKYIIPGPTSKYGEKLIFKWSDGNVLYVPHSSRMTMNPAPDKRKYRPQDDGGAEVYARVGTAPTHVTMYYTSDFGETQPDQPTEPVSGE